METGWPLLPEAPPRAVQKDIFQGGAPHMDLLVRDLLQLGELQQAGQKALGIARGNLPEIPPLLHGLIQLGGELPGIGSRAFERELHDTGEFKLLDEFQWFAGGEDAAMIHDRQAVAQSLGLFHVVGGQDDRSALALHVPDDLPE